MAKVKVLMNNGVIKTMESRFARALVHCRKAMYVDDYEKKVIENNSYLNKSSIENPPEIPNGLIGFPKEYMNLHQEDKIDTDSEITALRKEYSDKFGKKCYHGWNAEEIKAKIESE